MENIFDIIKTYSGWFEFEVREFNAAEKAMVYPVGKVVLGDEDFSTPSVMFKYINGKYGYINLSPMSALNIGDEVNINDLLYVELHKGTVGTSDYAVCYKCREKTAQ